MALKEVLATDQTAVAAYKTVLPHGLPTVALKEVLAIDQRVEAA